MPVEVGDETIRVRVREPGDFEKDSFRTIMIGEESDGIQAVVGRLSGEDTTSVQTYLFDAEKWSEETATAWVDEHKPGEKGLKALDARLIVYKQGEAYRWVMTSSNAFEDREGEIVSQKALEADVARLDAAGEYGPLRWWHLGEVDSKSLKAGKGLDLGVCDYNGMHGRILVESGTFDDPLVGAAMEKAADKLGGSIGFFHPLDEPDKEGVYKNVLRFERSLLPKEFAANGLVELTATKEVSVEDEKIKALRGLLGDELADTVLAKAGETEQKALEAGVRFKGEEKPPEVPAKGGIVDKILGLAGLGKKETAPPAEPEPEPVPVPLPVPEPAPAAKPALEPAALKEEDYTARVSAVSTVVGALNPPASNGPPVGAAVPEAPVAETPTGKADEPKPPETVGMMTLEQLTGLVKELVAGILAAGASDEKASREKAAGEITRIDGDLIKVKEAGEALGKIVANLVSEQPRALVETLRASVSAETELAKLPPEVQERLRGQAPGPDKHFTDKFLDGITASGKGMAAELVKGGGPPAG